MSKSPKEKLSARHTLVFFYRATIKHRRYALLSLLFPLGAIFLSVAAPFFAGRVLAGIAQNSPDLSSDLLLLGLSSLLGVLGNRFGFNALMVAQAYTLRELHQMVFNRLLARSVGFHSNRISGKLVSDAIDFVSSYGQLLGAVYLSGIPFALSVLVGLVVTIVNSWQLGAFLTVVVAITVAWAYWDSKVRKDMRLERLIASKALTAHLSDTIVNTQTVKTFSQEKMEAERNSKLNQRLQAIRIHDWQRSGRSGSHRMAALLLLQFLMVLYIVHLTRANPEMLATGIFAFTYTFMLSTKLLDINGLTRIIDEALLNAAPITNMLREDVEIQDRTDAKVIEVTNGAIEIHNAHFSYQESPQSGEVFDGLTLNVKPGEKIGLVGPSGGGKSTLTRLLLRFDDLQAGSINIDGQNIADVTQESLRANIAYVPQEPLLFHRSIGENIGYGRLDADNDDLVEAARKARAHEFISKLPNGYETVVGERGVKLSGGQRQRVAIARAILKDAPVLILDEATSSLDSESEVLIQEALWELMKDRTAIVIAHRLSTIQRMDRIVVMEDGRISEEGTHKELIDKKGTYARLWSHQSGGFIEE